MLRFISNLDRNTEKFGEKIGTLLDNGDIVCLTGDLGVGKTTFVKGIARGLGIVDHLTSPTFTIVNEYYGNKKLYHFDVYRVNDPDELYEIGFDEYIYDEAISVIEWAELIQSILPKEKLNITINKDISKGIDYREIIVESQGKRFDKLAKEIGEYINENFSD